MSAKTKVKLAGLWEFECLNPDGSVAWRHLIPNGPTTAALNALLEAFFAGGSQVTTWYIGLIDATGFEAFAAADTPASHAGWSEWTSYTQSTRQEWVDGTAAGGIKTSTTAASFTVLSNGTVHGGFLISDSTKGGTTGTLWATGALTNPEAVTIGQTIRVNYRVIASGS